MPEYRLTEWQQISRDPFARTTLFKRRIVGPVDACEWCSTVYSTRGGLAGYLFQYAEEKDGISTQKIEIPGRFCSAACMRSFHDKK